MVAMDRNGVLECVLQKREDIEEYKGAPMPENVVGEVQITELRMK
jgi:hypothetical protein